MNPRTPLRLPARRHHAHRRAAALAAAVLVLVLLNLSIISGIDAGADDARLAGRRIETLRAFLAAESGARVALGELTFGREVPDGAQPIPSGPTFQITQSQTQDGTELSILGRSGEALRRITINLE